MENITTTNVNNQIRKYIRSNYNINVMMLREYLTQLVNNDVIEKYILTDCLVGRGGIIKRKLNPTRRLTPGDLLDGDLVIGVVDDEYVVLQQDDSSINSPIISCKIIIQQKHNINRICIAINV